MKISFLTKNKDDGSGLLGSSVRGFTLIELIITVGILAVLTTIIVVAINPAEQLARSRDAKRVGDLDAMKSAINLYLATATNTIVLDGGTNTLCKNGGGTRSVWVNASSGSIVAGAFAGSATVVSSTVQTVGITGWLPAKLTDTPGGAAIGVLPLDPSGQGTGNIYYYAYGCEEDNKKFELGAQLESTYFLTDLDLDGKDGGASSTRYETGSDMTIL